MHLLQQHRPACPTSIEYRQYLPAKRIFLIKAPDKLNFVIADDDRLTRNVLRMLLNEGYHRIVGEAGDGEKALELCIEHQPDIAFIDIDMPKLDGHQATQKIRESCKNTQVIVVSSLATASNVQQALQAGASGFVVKPFNSNKINESIQQCVKKLKAA
jgi:YesN/AraC family two-component response regulator